MYTILSFGFKEIVDNEIEEFQQMFKDCINEKELENYFFNHIFVS